MQAYSRRFQQIAAAGTCHELAALPLPTSAFFNWTTEILESLHVAAYPHKTDGTSAG